MRSRCFIWFPISDLGEPNIYHDSGMFYKEVGILIGGCLTVKNYWGVKSYYFYQFQEYPIYNMG